MVSKLRIHAILLLTALLTAAVPAQASKGYGTQFWAATTYVTPLSESQYSASGVTQALKASSEMGYQFGVEFRSGFIGLAFDYLQAKHTFDANTLALDATFNPISGTLQLHLPLPVLDLYAGPTVSYVNWGDLKGQLNGTAQTAKVDAKLGYGFTVGGDLPLGHTLALTSGVRWLKLDATSKALPTTVAVDPLIARLGIALRF